MPAGEFKTHCLRVMDEVQRGRVSVVITKRGKPIAKLVPIEQGQREIFGCLGDAIEIVGDILAPAVPPDDWEATRD
jgi:prevent-host-death family protein